MQHAGEICRRNRLSDLVAGLTNLTLQGATQLSIDLGARLLADDLLIILDRWADCWRPWRGVASRLWWVYDARLGADGVRRGCVMANGTYH